MMNLSARISSGFFIGLLFLNFHVSISTRINYHDYRLYRFEPKNEVLDLLHLMEETESRFDGAGNRMPLIDFFAEPNRNQRDALVLIAPEFNQLFLQILDTRGVKNASLIKSNIQNDIVAEQNAIIKKQRKHRRKRTLPGEKTRLDIMSYNRYDKIVGYLKSLAETKPDMVTFYNISKTFEQRDMVGLKITSPNSKVAKQSMFIDAGVHAREWISVSVSVYMIERMVNEYETNDQIKWLLDNFDWWIIPMANPDGYEYSMTVDRMWRKTRSKNDEVNRWCRGTDANRNWGFRWAEVGATRSPCSSTYAGSEAFSEPEVTGLREFVRKNVQNLKVYISFHAYGQLFLSPWGYTSERPKNYRDQLIAAQYAVNAIQKETGEVYSYGTIAEVMCKFLTSDARKMNVADPASGTSIDYFQSQGVPFVYGIELRPLDSDSNAGFTVAQSEIEPTGREMLAAIYSIGHYVNGDLPKRLLVKKKRQ